MKAVSHSAVNEHAIVRNSDSFIKKSACSYRARITIVASIMYFMLCLLFLFFVFR